jgi:vacuolar protein sorting-associated protein 72
MTDTMQDPSSGLPSSEEEEQEEEQEEVPVESLVRGRAKRSTAGLHMSALLEAAADDDLALLFEEVEDDNEFADIVDPDAEEDIGLESSEDDEDDQGPNAQNNYEGEQQLQKDERKKRKTQNDLRFQTLRKRVKIDPTAVSAMAPAPRPKKKSERISWIPTMEDGPTRQSSRRQTMVNKELTHARLKDSQEKRVRIIATMKEAEKRKAHLKPKEMTQHDHLVEAARIERLNSKSLNRWELSEKRKADERRARIEALQNRRLDGPVLSYWSGVATWTNGRLTRVGSIDIKPKPDKEEARKKKKEKEDKEKAAADLQALAPAPIVGPTTITGPFLAPVATSNQPSGSISVEAATMTGTLALPNPAPSCDQKTPENPSSDNTTTVVQGTLDGTTDVPSASTAVEADKTDAKSPVAKITSTVPSPDQKRANDVEGASGAQPASGPLEQDKTPAEKQISEPAAEAAAAAPLPPPPIRRESFAVEITVPRHLSRSSSGSTPKLPESSSIKMHDAMDIDHPPAAAAAAQDGPRVQESTDKSILATPDAAGAQPIAGEIPKTNAVGPTVVQTSPSESQPVESVTSISPATALAPQAAPTAATPTQATVPESAPTPSLNQPMLQSESQFANVKIEAPSQPEVPQPPPVIEHTGRTLTILENFDYATAQKPKYSMYFNAKKPPRLTSMLHLFQNMNRANLTQKSRHRFASSLPCHRDTAIQKPVSPTPIPTPMARSAVCSQKDTSGARCLGVSSARPRLPVEFLRGFHLLQSWAPEKETGAWPDRWRSRMFPLPPPQRLNRLSQRLRRLHRCFQGSQWRLTNERFILYDIVIIVDTRESRIENRE